MQSMIAATCHSMSTQGNSKQENQKILCCVQQAPCCSSYHGHFKCAVIVHSHAKGEACSDGLLGIIVTLFILLPPHDDDDSSSSAVQFQQRPARLVSLHLAHLAVGQSVLGLWNTRSTDSCKVHVQTGGDSVQDAHTTDSCKHRS